MATSGVHVSCLRSPDWLIVCMSKQAVCCPVQIHSVLGLLLNQLVLHLVHLQLSGAQLGLSEAAVRALVLQPWVHC